MAYVDGFVVPVPKDRVDDYKALSRVAREVWLEYGALEYVECLGDDVPMGERTSFPRAVQLAGDEVVASPGSSIPRAKRVTTSCGNACPIPGSGSGKATCRSTANA